MEEKFSIEASGLEYKRFIDELGVDPLKLMKVEEESKDPLIEFIQYGYATVKDDGSIVYNFQHKIEGIDKESVTFKPRRFRVEDIEKRQKGKSDVEDARRMMGLFTSENSGIFAKMDPDDFVNITKIAQFFLPQ